MAMRFVGPGHAFHPESGLCRRCGLDLLDPQAEVACANAPVNPHPPRRGKGAPDIYELSRKQAETE